MKKPPLLSAIGELAVVGEQAGLSLEQMAELLDGGMSVEKLWT